MISDVQEAYVKHAARTLFAACTDYGAVDSIALALMTAARREAKIQNSQAGEILIILSTELHRLHDADVK